MATRAEAAAAEKARRQSLANAKVTNPAASSGKTIAQNNAQAQTAQHQFALANNKTGGVTKTVQLPLSQGGGMVQQSTGKVGKAQMVDNPNAPVMMQVTDPVTGLSSYVQQKDDQGKPLFEKMVAKDASGNPIFDLANPNMPLPSVSSPETSARQPGGAMGKVGSTGFNPSVSEGVGVTSMTNKGFNATSIEDNKRRLAEIDTRLGEINVQIPNELGEGRPALQKEAQDLLNEKGKVQGDIGWLEQDEKNKVETAGQTEGTMREQRLNTTPEATPGEMGIDTSTDLGKAYQNTLDELENIKGENAATKDEIMGIVSKGFEDINKSLTEDKGAIYGMQEFIDTKLREDLDNQQKVLEQQKESAQAQLVTKKQDDLRQAASDKVDAVDSMIARLALTGGIGSSGRNAEVRGAAQEFENKMALIRRNFGLDSADLEVKYSGLFAEAASKYNLASIQNVRDTFTALQANSNQTRASMEARMTAESGILSKFNEQNQKSRMDRANTLLGYAKEMAELVATSIKESQKGMMTTKDKLGFTSGLRSEINSKKTLTTANDVDGFYGAMMAGYNEYQRIKKDPKADDESLNAASTTAIGSFARMLDPGSVVRNEEYERQMYGQSFLNTAKGYWEKLQRGGAGLTANDIESMKNVADKIHSAWEERLSQEMQPVIMSIDSWNTSYPEENIKYSEVFNINRVHLPSQTLDTWKSQANSNIPTVTRSDLNSQSSLYDFFSVYAPSADNNNPKGYAENVAQQLGVDPNDAVGTLDIDGFSQAIANHEGFTSGASRLAVVNNNPGNLRYIGQKGASIGEGGFAKFATVADGWAALKNDILAKRGQAPAQGQPQNTYALVPTAEAAKPDEIIYIEDTPNEEPIEVSRGWLDTAPLWRKLYSKLESIGSKPSK